MTAFLEYLTALERVHCVTPRVLGSELGRQCAEFGRRGWVATDGYLSHVMVPFLNSEEEVQADIDEDAQVYRYRCPQRRSRIVERPLVEITRHAFRIDTWLDDLVTLIGIEPRHLSVRRTRVAGHLWHLGDVRISRSHDFAPVFVVRRWSLAPKAELSAALCDPIWPRAGLLLRHRPSDCELPCDHVSRGMGEFVREGDGPEASWDACAFDRVMRGFVTPGGVPEPEQFLQGNRFKLPHFLHSRELSPERARIVKAMWGGEGKTPPAMPWAEVNGLLNTGYQSFDDAFGGVNARQDVLEKTQRGRYRVRRIP